MYPEGMFRDHGDIIEAWPRPSLQTFADDIGVKLPTAKAMKRRLSIHWSYWDAVTKAAKRRHIKGINQKTLARLAPTKRGRTFPVSALQVA